MKADETTLYLNAKEREALNRILSQLAVEVSLSHDWYFREELENDIRLLQDRLDAATTDSLVKEGGQ